MTPEQVAEHMGYRVAPGRITCQCGEVISTRPFWVGDSSWPASAQATHLAALFNNAAYWAAADEARDMDAIRDDARDDEIKGYEL